MEPRTAPSRRSIARTRFVIPALVAVFFSGCGGSGNSAKSGGIHKIKHVVMIMQENRSFDHYFGTYPGADGIPMKNGVPTVCAPSLVSHVCVRPYPDHADM